MLIHKTKLCLLDFKNLALRQGKSLGKTEIKDV